MAVDIGDKHHKLPKSFYHYQLNNPKNKKLAVIAEDALKLAAQDKLDGHQIDHALIKLAAKQKEEEAKYWQEELNKLMEKDDDYSVAEYSEYPKGRGSRSNILRPSNNMKDEAVQIDQNREVGPNDPVSRPTYNPRENPENSRSASPKEEPAPRRDILSGISRSKVHQGKLNVAGPINPNLYLSNNNANMPRLDDRMHYDPHNNDINRNANKAFNAVNHITFLGAMRPANDEDMDRLRAIQRNQANREMLIQQMKDNQNRKLLEKERRRLEEMQEQDRLKKENDVLEKRAQAEKKRELEKTKRFQHENLKLIEEKREAVGGKRGEISKVSAFSAGLGGIDANSKVFTEKDLEEEIKNASSQMISNRERVKNQLQEDLFKEKEFMMLLPEEINKKIALIMNQQLDRMKFELNQGTNQLRDNIINLRAKAIELDEERRRAAHEVNKLRSHLAQIQYEDDIRTNEMFAAMADDNLNRILPSSSRFNMPEALIRDYEQYNFPISQYESVIKMDGSEKVFSDGYFENAFLAPNENAGYKLSNVGRMVDDAYKVEEIYNKNSVRDQVFKDSLDDRIGHFSLQDYLDKDLEDHQRQAGKGFDLKF